MSGFDDAWIQERARRTANSFRSRARRLTRGESVAPADVAEWLRMVVMVRAPHCAYCLVPLTPFSLQIDHAVPLARGGPNVVQNFLLACAGCNQAKGMMTLNEFRSLRDCARTWPDKGKYLFQQLRQANSAARFARLAKPKGEW